MIWDNTIPVPSGYINWRPLKAEQRGPWHALKPMTLTDYNVKSSFETCAVTFSLEIEVLWLCCCTLAFGHNEAYLPNHSCTIYRGRIR